MMNMERLLKVIQELAQSSPSLPTRSLAKELLSALQKRPQHWDGRKIVIVQPDYKPPTGRKKPLIEEKVRPTRRKTVIVQPDYKPPTGGRKPALDKRIAEISDALIKGADHPVDQPKISYLKKAMR